MAAANREAKVYMYISLYFVISNGLMTRDKNGNEMQTTV